MMTSGAERFLGVLSALFLKHYSCLSKDRMISVFIELSLFQVIQVQKRMLVEQRAVIERLSCKLGKDHEDVELQFSAAVAKVIYIL